MAITFNFRQKKEEKLEKYNFPVLTKRPYSGEKHSVAKFEMNKALLDQLGYPEVLKDCKISVGKVDDRLVLVNSTGVETDKQYNVNSDGSVNTKFLMKRIHKEFNISPAEEEDLYLTVQTDEETGMKYAIIENTVQEYYDYMNWVEASTEMFDAEEEMIPEPIQDEPTKGRDSQTVIEEESQTPYINNLRMEAGY